MIPWEVHFLIDADLAQGAEKNTTEDSLSGTPSNCDLLRCAAATSCLPHA